MPFCWESSLSGIQDKSGQKIGWYRRDFTVPAEWRGRHAWLRFEAVDWEARVWVNGKELGIPQGGTGPWSGLLAARFAFFLRSSASHGPESAIIRGSRGFITRDAETKGLPFVNFVTFVPWWFK